MRNEALLLTYPALDLDDTWPSYQGAKVPKSQKTAKNRFLVDWNPRLQDRFAVQNICCRPQEGLLSWLSEKDHFAVQNTSSGDLNSLFCRDRWPACVELINAHLLTPQGPDLNDTRSRNSVPRFEGFAASRF